MQIAICSLLGTPWFVAATVLSINHIRSLTRESDCAAPGERPKFLGVRYVLMIYQHCWLQLLLPLLCLLSHCSCFLEVLCLTNKLRHYVDY